jgi:hypothetical protein
MQTTTTPIQLPPIYNQLTKHAVFPEVTHDETARYNFLANLNKHLSTVIAPANAVAFEKRVRPAFKRRKKRDFDSREEVKEAMQRDPQYQTWSALRRATMETSGQKFGFAAGGKVGKTSRCPQYAIARNVDFESKC